MQPLGQCHADPAKRPVATPCAVEVALGSCCVRWSVPSNTPPGPSNGQGLTSQYNSCSQQTLSHGQSHPDPCLPRPSSSPSFVDHQAQLPSSLEGG